MSGAWNFFGMTIIFLFHIFGRPCTWAWLEVVNSPLSQGLELAKKYLSSKASFQSKTKDYKNKDCIYNLWQKHSHQSHGAQSGQIL